MRRLALALVILFAAGVSACGGGGGEEGEIRAMIEASSTSSNPGDCLRYSTLNLLEQTHKVQGRAAVRACEESALEPHDLPTAVEVTRIKVDGDRATAQIASVGGPHEEQEMVVALVEDDGSWKGHEILEFAVFDREAFLLETGREMMENAGSGEEANAFACVIGQLERMDDSELEALLLDPSPQPSSDLARPCLPRADSV